MAGVAVGAADPPARVAVERGHEARFDRAAEQSAVDAASMTPRRSYAASASDVNEPLHDRGEQRRRRPLAGDVADREAEPPFGRLRRSRRSRRRPLGTAIVAAARRTRHWLRGSRRQQRLLNLPPRCAAPARHARFSSTSRYRRAFSMTTRRFGRQRAQRVDVLQVAALATVEIQHADASGAFAAARP